MAIARVSAQDAKNSGTTSASATYPSVPIVGNLLIAAVADDFGLPRSITGWAQAVTSSGNTKAVSIFYKVAGIAEATTITTDVNGSAGQTNLLIYEYSGFAGIPTLDKTAANPNGATALTYPTGTTAKTTYPNELVFAAVFGVQTNTLSAWSNGFTAIASVGTETAFTAQNIVAVTATYSSTLTVTGTTTANEGAIATFFDTPRNRIRTQPLRPHPFSPGLAR